MGSPLAETGRGEITAQGAFNMSEYPINFRSALSLVLLGLSVSIVGCAVNGGTREAGLHYPTGPFRLESTEWPEYKPGPSGLPKGAQRVVLGTDPKSGGDTYYAHFPAGTRFELHWHAYQEYAVVLRGKVIHTLGTEKSSMQAGDYVVIPPRIAHGWEVDPSGDAYLLIRRDGPDDLNFVRPEHAAIAPGR
jgi:quercetin dioxygenase-like cupin family protein